MSDLDLCYMSASQTMARFKAHTLSPVESLDALIERAEEVAQKVKAFNYRHNDQALKQAEARFKESVDDIHILKIAN